MPERRPLCPPKFRALTSLSRCELWQFRRSLRTDDALCTSNLAPTGRPMHSIHSFGDYRVVHADYSMVHLWIVDLPKTDHAGRTTAVGEPKLLTVGDDFSVGSFSFSPDGTRMAFSAQRDPDLISGFSSDIYTVTV